VSYCNGDGSVTPCPCANDAPAGTLGGCLNSLGFSGQLSVQAWRTSASTPAPGRHRPCPTRPRSSCNGSARENSGAGTVFGDPGLQCLSGSIMRLGAAHRGEQHGQHTPLPGGTPISVRGACRPGATCASTRI
jgi:hypothetical protein